MDHLFNSRIEQLQDEIRDARRTIDRLERREAYFQDEAKRQAESLSEDLSASRKDRNELRVFISERDVELASIRAEGVDQREETEKLRIQFESRIQALQTDVRLYEKLAEDRLVQAEEAEGSKQGAGRRLQEAENERDEAQERCRLAEDKQKSVEEQLKESEVMRRNIERALLAKDERINALVAARATQTVSTPQLSSLSTITAGTVPSRTPDDHSCLKLSPPELEVIEIDSDDSPEIININSSPPPLPSASGSPKPEPKRTIHPELLSPPPSSLMLKRAIDPSVYANDETPLPKRVKVESQQAAESSLSLKPASSSLRIREAQPSPPNPTLLTPPAKLPSDGVPESPLPRVPFVVIDVPRRIFSKLPIAGPSSSAHRSSLSNQSDSNVPERASLRPRSLKIPASVNARVFSYPSISIPMQNPPPPSTRHPRYPGYVRRQFLEDQYGCSDRLFLGKIGASRNVPSSSKDDRSLLFPLWDSNPSIPERPGQPGTLITNRFDILEHSPVSLFARAPEATWLYMGNYELKKSKKPLTPSEFKGLPEQTRIKWANDMLRPQKWECYLSMRARVWLRKNGRKVTESAIAAMLRPKMKPAELGLGTADMLRALDAGEEELNVLLCLPVSYDADFQRDLTARYAQWEAAPEGSPANAKSCRRKQILAKAGLQTQHREEAEQVPSEDSEAETENLVGSEATAVKSSPSLRRSTRRRQRLWSSSPEGGDEDDDDEDYEE